MKRFGNTTHFYKITYFSLTIIYLLFTLSAGFLGLQFLENQYTQKLKLLGNITGAVLSEDPSLEDTLLDAIQNPDERYIEYGFALLNRYGYRETLSIYDDTHYLGRIEKFLPLLLVFFLLSFIIIMIHFHLLSLHRKIQEKRLLTLLDRCLSEDYTFLERHGATDIIFNEAFTDTFMKLGQKLKYKTQILSEERDNTKTLVTDISHQLKTPVSALKNCLSMSMEADSPRERDEFLQRCVLQLNKLEQLIGSLINISRLETSIITLHKNDAVLSDILIDAVNTVYVKAMQKEITIEVIDIPDEKTQEAASSLTLSLDKKWTAEAFANILDNAVKYSPVKSMITVRLQKLYSYVRIEIEDAGIGISKKEYNKIFRRFYRGSHPAVQRSEGSGVGLYLSRKIIEEQGGSVTVKPAYRQGSVFVVQLPLSLVES